MRSCVISIDDSTKPKPLAVFRQHIGADDLGLSALEDADDRAFSLACLFPFARRRGHANHDLVPVHGIKPALNGNEDIGVALFFGEHEAVAGRMGLEFTGDEVHFFRQTIAVAACFDHLALDRELYQYLLECVAVLGFEPQELHQLADQQRFPPWSHDLDDLFVVYFISLSFSAPPHLYPLPWGREKCSPSSMGGGRGGVPYILISFRRFGHDHRAADRCSARTRRRVSSTSLPDQELFSRRGSGLELYGHLSGYGRDSERDGKLGHGLVQKRRNDAAVDNAFKALVRVP
jgi:hypothetical protein